MSLVLEPTQDLEKLVKKQVFTNLKLKKAWNIRVWNSKKLKNLSLKLEFFKFHNPVSSRVEY